MRSCCGERTVFCTRLSEMVDVTGDAGPMLLAAAKRGNLSFMERIIGENKKINLDAKDGLGNTPLHYSAAGGHYETLNYLVDKGADPNVQNFAGDTPLHNAVSRNHRESIQALLEAGSDANIENKKKLTPVHLAKCHEVRTLLQKSAKEKKEVDEFDDMDMLADLDDL